MTKPKYQEISNKDIPNILLGENTKLRVIAGTYKGQGPSSTFTEINLYDIISNENKKNFLKFKNGTNTVILIMRWRIRN